MSATFTTGKRRAGSPSESGSTALAPFECDGRRHGEDDACRRCQATASGSLVAAAAAAPERQFSDSPETPVAYAAAGLAAPEVETPTAEAALTGAA
jgi:hypothetical protein